MCSKNVSKMVVSRRLLGTQTGPKLLLHGRTGCQNWGDWFSFEVFDASFEIISKNGRLKAPFGYPNWAKIALHGGTLTPCLTCAQYIPSCLGSSDFLVVLACCQWLHSVPNMPASISRSASTFFYCGFYLVSCEACICCVCLRSKKRTKRAREAKFRL